MVLAIRFDVDGRNAREVFSIEMGTEKQSEGEAVTRFDATSVSEIRDLGSN